MKTKRESVTKEQTNCVVSHQSLNYSYGAATPSGGGKSGCVHFECFLF